jgi:DNA-binding response OmpR family regulator
MNKKPYEKGDRSAAGIDANVQGWVRAELCFELGPTSFRCGSTRVDLATRAAWVVGRPIALRPQEARLLALLWTAANRVVPNESLILSLYGNISVTSGRSRLKRLVADIRKRLGEEVATRLRTVPKVGLVLYAEGIEPNDLLRSARPEDAVPPSH